MTFNPEAFVDMKDKFFLLNGRSYPDTVQAGPLATQSSDGRMHYSQPLPSIINIHRWEDERCYALRTSTSLSIRRWPHWEFA